MAAKQDQARRGALMLLSGVLGSGRMLSEVDLSRLSAPDRARALRLAQTVLRHLGKADALLTPKLKKRPPLAVQNALRLAVVEVAELGAPAHGAVSATVGLLRAHPKTRNFAALANAVLRSVTEDVTANWADLPPKRLDPWIRRPIEKQWGDAVAGLIEAAHQRPAPTDLTPGPAMTPQFRAGIEATDLPTGSLRLTGSAQVTALPGFAEGAFWVQDAAAALPAQVLAAKPGERVLDLCAAPGGKTLQLAATGADVTAVDLSADRMKLVTENLARTGQRAETIVADLLKWSPAAPADAILLDAPCSATGTIRRHPDLPHVKDGAGIRDLFDLQSRLIDRAIGWLKPGGRLVYSTCSLLPPEGERQALAALDRHPGIRLDPKAFDLPGIAPDWVTEAGLRLRPDLWPDLGGMDGFFIAVFTKD